MSEQTRKELIARAVHLSMAISRLWEAWRLLYDEPDRERKEYLVRAINALIELENELDRELARHIRW